MMAEAKNSLLVITGSMGAGKTSVLAEASDILTLRRMHHAAIDLDALGLAYVPSATEDGLMYANLRSICENYVKLGVQRFLLARAVENSSQLEMCRDAVSATNIVVCRLVAEMETMQQRVKIRETGISGIQFVARVATLNDILDRALLENFTVLNEGRTVNDVALEMLMKAGWLSS
jgi:hypothetical protein